MTKGKIIATILIGICLGIGLYTINVARAKYRRSTNPQQLTLPYGMEVTSCAKGIRVLKAEVVKAGTPSATVEVQIENLSDFGIVAVAMDASKNGESYTVTLRSSFKETKPTVVIKPHETGSLNMQLFFGDVPLRIGSVFYENGTEEGCASSLKTLREVRESENSKGALHETNPPNSNPSHR